MADLVLLLRSYVERMLREAGAGMKAQLLDVETTRIVSTVFSQTELLEHEVFLVERLDEDKGDQLFHLKAGSPTAHFALSSLCAEWFGGWKGRLGSGAVCFLRPTRENVARARRELRGPRFGEYHLFFSNRVDDMRLQDLADGDVREMVQSVQEHFGDFVALDSHLFVVPIPRTHVALQPLAWDYGNASDAITRLTEGLASLVLSLRRRFTMRYQRGSEVCERLAQSLHHLTTVEERELFDFGSRNGEATPVLLLLDRRDDPVTPLLSQWTYQAMVHELVGLSYNRADLRGVAGVKPEFAEVVLSAHHDPFFKANMYANFGDVGLAVKGLVDSWRGESRAAGDFQSLEDMASFVENLSEYNHQQGLTYKHVTLMGELSHAVERRQLMAVSGLEQDLACQAPALAAHFEAALLAQPELELPDKLRLAMLFALRYEREGRPQIMALTKQLEAAGASPAQLGLLAALLARCGGERRVQDLFSDRSLAGRFASLAKQHLKGVENHTPPLAGLLERLGRGRLPDADYPRVDRAASASAASLSGAASASGAHKPARLVVVFVVGGATYEEAKAVAELNAAGERGEGWSAGVRLLLGGTSMQSGATFLADLAEVAAAERAALALTCKTAYGCMQQHPGVWHPTARLVGVGWRAEAARRFSLLSWLQKYEPQLASIRETTLESLALKGGPDSGKLTHLVLPSFTWRLSSPVHTLPDLSGLPGVRQLACDRIDTGVEQLLRLPALTSLSVESFGQDTQEWQVPSAIGQLTSLRWLEIRDARSMDFKSFCASLPHSLTGMHIAGRDNYVALPPALGSMSALCELELPDVGVTGGWSALGCLRKLRYLELSLAHGALPQALRQLSRLHELDRGFEHLPGEKLTSLELCLDGERPDDFFGRGIGDDDDDCLATLPPLLHLTRLRTLTVSRCKVDHGFGELPVSLNSLDLRLEGNYIPSELSRLTNLTRLAVLAGVQHLPPSVCKFT
eukprot:scaffold19.g1827.t1